MKICSACSIEKPLEDYAVKSRNKDGRTARCKECTNPIQRKQYHENPDNQKNSVKERKAYNRERIANYKISHACVDCHKFYPSYVMDFDHVRGTKRDAVSQLVSHTWDIIQEEIDKCDLVCANCHRERTFMRLGSTQLDYYHEDYQLD